MSLEEVNRFPVELNSEVFLGESLTITVRFTVYFPVDEVHYIPVNKRLALFLSQNPEVDSPPGFGIKVVDASCVPREISFLIGQNHLSATAGEVSTRLAITPSPELAPGDYNLTVRFPAIDTAYSILNAIPPAAPAMARLNLQVWASKEAKAEIMRKIRIEWMKRIIAILGIFALATPLLLWLWRWIHPSFHFTVPAGGHSQEPGGMLPFQIVSSAEPGSIVTFRWARNFVGHRQRIKVETLWTGAQTDLLVSVGASVRPGWYIAGNVRVKVPKSR